MEGYNILNTVNIRILYHCKHDRLHEWTFVSTILVNLKNPLLRGLPFDMWIHMSKYNIATMKHEHTS